MLDPKKAYISQVLDRRHCVERDTGVFLKDLRVLRGRPLDRLVAVDSTLLAFMSQLDNGILVPRYGGGQEDRELRTVQEFLLTLGGGDVRPLVRKFAGIARVIKMFSNEEKRSDPRCGQREVDEVEPRIGSEYE